MRPGDDAAILPAAGETAVSVDSQIGGVHFPEDLDPRQIGRRLVAVNLSDLAAMGAVPRHAFAALSSPEGFDRRSFFEGLLAACDTHQLILSGGDLAHSPERVVATLTVVGEQAPDGRWLRRGAARPGHALWVGGSLGESALGCRLVARGARRRGSRIDLPPGISPHLAKTARRAVRRHLEPKPQIPLGQALATAHRQGAAMDVSDGLTLDLDRLCRESGVGAVIDAPLPFAPQTKELAAALDADLGDLALGGGEDYVLLFTLPSGERVSAPDGTGCRRIGKIVKEKGIWRSERRRRVPLPIQGWDHLRSRTPT